MTHQLVHIDKYFATARERYKIKLKRDAGEQPPWTTDDHFRAWRFCQVHREDDKTTVWFRENVRSKLEGLAQVEATIIFRWFNRIETGERIKDLLLEGWDSGEARRRLTGVNPVVTGAYIIKCADGLSKLDGILQCVDNARLYLPRFVQTWNDQIRCNQSSLFSAWKDLKTLHFMGGFTAYEVVSDLRWGILRNAGDILTWANAGPGCARGLGWVVAGDSDTFNTGPANQKVMLDLMKEILKLSRDPQYWPQDWKPWEMREVEHWCCEHDKYMRAWSGERLKRRYA